MRLPSDTEPTLRDLFERLLCKDPCKRLDLTGLREHPWVADSDDPLPSKADNVATLIEDPTSDELGAALTPLISLSGALSVFKVRALLARAYGPLCVDRTPCARRSVVEAPVAELTPPSSLGKPNARPDDAPSARTSRAGMAAAKTRCSRLRCPRDRSPRSATTLSRRKCSRRPQ